MGVTGVIWRRWIAIWQKPSSHQTSNADVFCVIPMCSTPVFYTLKCWSLKQECQICHPNLLILARNGKIWEFLRSVSDHFGSLSQNVLKLTLKSPRFVPVGGNLSKFGCNAKFDIPGVEVWKRADHLRMCDVIICSNDNSRVGMWRLAPIWVRLVWNQIRQICPFFRSDFRTFWLNVLKSDLKKSGICPILCQSDSLLDQIWPGMSDLTCDWVRFA